MATNPLGNSHNSVSTFTQILLYLIFNLNTMYIRLTMIGFVCLTDHMINYPTANKYVIIEVDKDFAKNLSLNLATRNVTI